MSEDIYIKLRDKIDTYSVGLRPTDSGKELKILRQLFTEEEALIYLGMTRSLESSSTIASRLNMDAGVVGAHLDNMTEKGLTFPKTKDGVRYYAAAPFMHGFFEHQVFRKKKDPEIAPLFEDYITGGFVPKTSSMRSVPVMAEIDTKDLVLPYDDVKQVIQSKDRIGLFKCACHYQMSQVGPECKRPDEVCIAFDFYAEYVIEEMKWGRWVTRDEAMIVLQDSEEAGLVHQTVGNIQSTEAICNCCPDCCTMLRILKLHPTPGKYKSTNYRINQKSSGCTQCMTCIDRCPMNALTFESGEISLNRARCIGCGLCTTTCPSKALTLERKPDAEIKLPPENYDFLRTTKVLMEELEIESKRN